MSTLGARIERVLPGEVAISIPFRADLTQQHGYLHAGVVTTMIDSACGFAAFSLMPADATVLTVEFKINLIAPAEGHTLIARGRVVRAGRNVTVCNGEGWMRTSKGEKQVAQMLATMMTVRERGISG